MTLIKTSLLNAIAVAIKMLTMLGINKILAVYVGPSGYFLIGQFQSAIQVIMNAGGSSLNNGIIKYIAEYDGDKDAVNKITSSSFYIIITLALIISSVLFVFSKKISYYIFGSEYHYDVILIFSFTLTLFCVNGWMLSIINGFKKIKVLVFCNIAGSVVSFFVVVAFVYFLGLKGALISLAIYQAFYFFSTFFFFIKECNIRNYINFKNLDYFFSKKIVIFSVAAISSAICAPISHMVIRSNIVDHLGEVSAGYWEAMSRFSAVSLMFMTTTLSVYFLPKISGLRKFEEIKLEILNGYKLIIPFFVFVGFVFYFFRDWIIKILFSSEFLPIRDLFSAQILGDFMRIGSWLLAYVMLGRAMVKEFVFLEIFFSIFSVVLCIFLMDLFLLEGVVFSYVISYALYWLFVCFFVMDKKRYE